MNDTQRQMARAAARLAKKWAPAAKQSGRIAKEQMAKNWMPTARQSGQFVKHVLPAAVKPIHSLWHEVLGFIFLALAGLCAWRLWRTPPPIPLAELVLVPVLALVMAGYGISSIRKSRRISRS